jgi:class 3 adenylate cyclase
MSSQDDASFALRAWKSLTGALLTAALLLFVVFALPLVAPLVKGAAALPVVRELLGLQRSLVGAVRGVLPQALQNREVVGWLLLLAAGLLAVQANIMRGQARRKLEKLAALRQYEALSATRRSPDEARVLAPLKEKIDSLQESSKPADREELLRVFAETKKKLDAMGRDLAFLAVDVVDSTGMKSGEEQGIVERDFREYKKLVEGKIKEYGGLKAAWTPDGVMICLPSVDVAVRLGQDLISSLEGFNKHVKTIRRDFKIRCGINFGYVYFDPAVPMQEMSDRVIDVAGHMQKYADPNSIAIAKQAIEPVHSRDGFVTAGRVVDGYEVFIWPKEETKASGA